jgi:hypothetical protein
MTTLLGTSDLVLSHWCPNLSEPILEQSIGEALRDAAATWKEETALVEGHQDKAISIEEKFSFGIKLICPVQSSPQKEICSRRTQITFTTHPVSSHSRGASRSSRTRDGMRWTLRRY